MNIVPAYKDGIIPWSVALWMAEREHARSGERQRVYRTITGCWSWVAAA